MPQTSGVVSIRMIAGVNREIMYLDRITNAYCDHNIRTARPRGATRTNMVIQCTGNPGKAAAYAFLDNNDVNNNQFYLDVSNLKDHLNQLWSEYKFRFLQEYDQSRPAYVVDENKWRTHQDTLKNLIDNHNGGGWAPILFRMIGVNIDPTSTGDAHFARDRPRLAPSAGTRTATDIDCWRTFQQIALSELTIPYLVKMNRNVFHLKFEVNQSASLLTSPPPVPAIAATDYPRNWLWLGAPGTGKSYDLNLIAQGFVASVNDDLFKMTFHPSTSYFNFIGDYRPLTLYKTNPTPPLPTYVGLDTSPVARPGEISIDYSFVPGMFLNAFIRAVENPNLRIVVIVDEINRGNIFDIMGEVLHLMERDEVTNIGSNDIELMKPAMDYLQANCTGFTEVRLPENLYLWATMNPNDHSVHRIDSAFVRRWTTKYVGINYPIAGVIPRFTVPSPIGMDWGILRDQINRRLGENGIDESQMIGFWYLKGFEFATWELFYSKLVFHLANNVVKHDLRCLFNADYNSVKEIMEACSANLNPFDL